ncbi:hypothetical protein COV22_02330, partial [Candidatus Woesearchaeota archaeon CG10_big_fil_rev_8_21_14_0_10_47_5]
MKERITLTLDSDLIRDIDSRIDGFQIKNRSHAIELLLFSALSRNCPRKAVILAAGSRTIQGYEEMLKPMAEVNKRPVLEHNINLLKKHNIKDIIITVGYKGREVKSYFQDGSRFGVRITYIEEDPAKLSGTAGPLRLMKDYLTDSFIMLYGDNLYELDILDMYSFHKKNKAEATVALKIMGGDVSKYGIVELKGNLVTNFLEKPSSGVKMQLVNSGMFILEPAVLELVP